MTNNNINKAVANIVTALGLGGRERMNTDLSFYPNNSTSKDLPPTGNSQYHITENDHYPQFAGDNDMARPPLNSDAIDSF